LKLPRTTPAPDWSRLFHGPSFELENKVEIEAMVEDWKRQDYHYRHRAIHRQLVRPVGPADLGVDHSFHSFCKDNKLLRYYRTLGVPIRGLDELQTGLHYHERLVCRLNLVLYAISAYVKEPIESSHLLSEDKMIHLIEQGTAEADIYARSSHVASINPQLFSRLVLRAAFRRLHYLLRNYSSKVVEHANHNDIQPIPLEIRLRVMVSQLGKLKYASDHMGTWARRIDGSIKFWISRCQHHNEVDEEDVGWWSHRVWKRGREVSGASKTQYETTT